MTPPPPPPKDLTALLIEARKNRPQDFVDIDFASWEVQMGEQ